MPKSNKNQNTTKSSSSKKGANSGKESNTDLQLPVVALGASAGGIQSLKVFFDHLSPDTGLGFIVVVHLDPNQKSSLDDILSTHTTMPVVHAADGVVIEPNHVYVGQPGQIIRLSEGKIQAKSAVRASRPIVIDELFESMANEKKHLGIGIVLSGFGVDGTRGSREIHAQDGLCFAENEESAEFSDMPNSAIDSGYIDFKASTKVLAEKITEIAPKIGAEISTTKDKDPTADEKEAVGRIFSILNKRCHINFAHYKDTTIHRRLDRRVMLKRQNSLSDYADYLDKNTGEQDLLCDDLLIKVTEFFRNKAIFKNLCSSVFAEMVQNAPPESTIRIWVAACSTGEEAYSLAICLMECIEEKNANIKVQVFATDVSDKAVNIARRGLYGKEIEQNVSQARLENYFSKTEGGYQVNKRIRDLCVFAKHNLIQDPPYSQLDLISCRNILIYFSAPIQKKLIPSFHYALKPDGYLWLGDAESTGNFNDLFKLEDNDTKIYRKKNTGDSRLYSPLFEFRYSPTPITTSPPSKSKELVDEEKIKTLADRLIINNLGPAGWVVDKDFRMIHIVGKTAPYISPRSGSPSHNLFDTIRNELHYPIKQGIEEIKQKNHSFAKEGITLSFNGDTKTVSMRIHALRLPPATAPYYMITMHDLATKQRVITGGTPGEPSEVDPAAAEIDALKQELEDVRFQIQSARESQDASNEELKAANEELLSGNEELRSTNEELQTAKEELQSTNEELATLNDELQNRNEDLALLSDDLENFIRSTNAPIIMLDRKLCIRRFTPASKNLFNIIPTDTARPLGDLRANFDLEGLDKIVLKVIDTLQIDKRDVQVENGNWYQLYIRPYKNGDNQIAGAVLSFTDITERKRIEKLTETSEEMFRDMVDTIREPLLILASDLVVTNVNESFSRVFEASREETIGSKLWQLGNGQWDIPKLRKLLLEILPENKIFNDFDVEHTFENIGRKIMRLNARQLDHKNLILLAIEDVTESQDTSDRLKNSESTFRFLFENAPVAIAIVDNRDEFVSVTPALCSLLGYTEAELLKLPYLQLISEGDRKRISQLDKKIFQNKKSDYKVELKLVRKNGKTVLVKLASLGIKSENGEIERRIGVFEDITFLKETTKMQEKARVSAEKSNQAKTDFLATMSHEIRTPLSAISGFTELLADRMRVMDGSDELQGFVQRIRNNSDFLKNLIEDILDLSRIEAGKINIEKSNFSLTDLVGEVVSLLKGQADSKGIGFDVRSDDNLPPRIYSDPQRLKQVLINIIGNAIKFTEEGEVTVNIGCTPDSDPQCPSQLRIKVKDTGIGIAKEHQQKLFQTFSQADSSVTRKYGGTGLGLILSKRIAEALGGDVVLSQSSPGEGSEFLITIGHCCLRGKSKGKALEMNELGKKETKSKRVISHTLAGMKILLAEDSVDIKMLMEYALRAVGGAEVDVAENGQVAVEKGGTGQYDLILMDTMMPVMGGYEATKLLKEKGVSTPIVALSARSLKSEIEEGLAAGCVEYLTKPVDINKILKVVRKYKSHR